MAHTLGKRLRAHECYATIKGRQCDRASTWVTPGQRHRLASTSIHK